jgi:hypothetical protein
MDKAGFSDNRPETHVRYTITARFSDGRIEKHSAIGGLNALIDAAYDRGALGVTAIARQAQPAPSGRCTTPL